MGSKDSADMSEGQKIPPHLVPLMEALEESVQQNEELRRYIEHETEQQKRTWEVFERRAEEFSESLDRLREITIEGKSGSHPLVVQIAVLTQRIEGVVEDSVELSTDLRHKISRVWAAYAKVRKAYQNVQKVHAELGRLRKDFDLHVSESREEKKAWKDRLWNLIYQSWPALVAGVAFVCYQLFWSLLSWVKTWEASP